MKTLGEEIFAKDADGKLVSKVGTIFLRTPGLVTRRGIHAMQRMMWIDEINKCRAEEGLSPLTAKEEDAEFANSVDLIFTPSLVLIRPDPDRMDLAIKADVELQKLVSKRKIRFLNTHSAKVRNALKERGENWRMARVPISQDDMRRQIENSKVSVEGCERIYYYNHATGTRYLTAEGCRAFQGLPADVFRERMKEAVTLLNRRNRFGMPELDLFPTTTPIEVKKTLKALNVDAMSDDELRKAAQECYTAWRMSMPAGLREESLDNFEWRNEMSRTLSTGPDDSAVEESELIQGISPEFYRQIEWLPGARIFHRQLIFDSVWDEAARSGEAELAAICDLRVRNIIFNFMRLFSEIEYINIGRIVHTLAKTPAQNVKRGSVYLVQFQMSGREDPHVVIIRFLKWGVAEHLDEGKDMLQAINEANEYADYILDRRLMCQQLGMKLPSRVGYGQFTEQYHGANKKYDGRTIRTAYDVRNYIKGTASDKIPCAKLRNPAFAHKFADLMGEAAALDMIVGRRSSQTGEMLFDTLYEVIQFGQDGLPARVVITSHAGSFVDYKGDFMEMVKPYARFVASRVKCIADIKAFAAKYVEAFERKLSEVQQEYRSNRIAFDELFVHRPFDAGGSGAYRWVKTLERLDKCVPSRVAAALSAAIEAEVN